MATVFLGGKKVFGYCLGVITVLFTLSAFLYSCVLMNASSLPLRKNFYFLASESEHAQATAYFIQADGGAGYPLTVKGKDYVAISVYLDYSDGVRALESYSEREESTLITLGTEKLYFKTAAEKRSAKKAQGAFYSLLGCIEVLEKEIARLENGATQQSCGRILKELENQFRFLKEEYSGLFSEFSTVCAWAEGETSHLQTKIIYLKDLRFILCDLCFSFVKLSQAYAL